MKEWIKAVENPLGLAAFALFLVFQILSYKAKRKRASGTESALLSGVFFVMSFLALVGGIWLAHEDRATRQQNDKTTAATTSKRATDAATSVNQSVSKSQNVIQVGNAKDVSISTTAPPKAGEPESTKSAVKPASKQ